MASAVAARELGLSPISPELGDFLSSVIAATSSSARSSGRRARFIQGWSSEAGETGVAVRHATSNVASVLEIASTAPYGGDSRMPYLA